MGLTPYFYNFCVAQQFSSFGLNDFGPKGLRCVIIPDAGNILHSCNLHDVVVLCYKEDFLRTLRHLFLTVLFTKNINRLFIDI